jgi:restriction endonuclease S subunit
MISINKFLKKNRMNFLPIDFEQNKIIEYSNDIISDKYLGYYLSHKYKNINLKTLKSFNIHIPPIEVQEEIVNYMNENNEKIDNLKKEIEDLNYKSSLWFMNVD